MKRIQRSALVAYSSQQMFDLINDISSYPDYLPGCVGSEILEQGEGWLTARLDLSSAGISHSFITRNTLNPPDSMSLELQEGPFSSLNGQWQFHALGDSACKVTFWLEFSVSNKLLGMAAGKLMEQVAAKQVDAICERAKSVYK